MSKRMKLETAFIKAIREFSKLKVGELRNMYLAGKGCGAFDIEIEYVDKDNNYHTEYIRIEEAA